MHNIDNYISNDNPNPYTEKSLGSQQSSSGFLHEKYTLSEKYIFFIYVSIWIQTPTLASVTFCLTVQTPPSEGDAPSKSGMT